MTYVDTSGISARMFITVLLFLLVIAPLVSLGVLRLFQANKRAGLLYLFGGAALYLLFQLVLSLVPE